MTVIQFPTHKQFMGVDLLEGKVQIRTTQLLTVDDHRKLVGELTYLATIIRDYVDKDNSDA